MYAKRAKLAGHCDTQGIAIVSFRQGCMKSVGHN